MNLLVERIKKIVAGTSRTFQSEKATILHVSIAAFTAPPEANCRKLIKNRIRLWLTF